jgi:acylphosphatase
MAECRRYRVTGRVQGVGFRWWTRRLGIQLGLRGDVRNKSDGSVEALVCGTLEDLGVFEERLRRGPPGSRVDLVEVEADTEGVPGPGFSIEGH